LQITSRRSSGSPHQTRVGSFQSSIEIAPLIWLASGCLNLLQWEAMTLPPAVVAFCTCGAKILGSAPPNKSVRLNSQRAATKRIAPMMPLTPCSAVLCAGSARIADDQGCIASQARAISSRVVNHTSGYWLAYSMNRRTARTRPARPMIRG